MTVEIIVGDTLEQLEALPAESAQCIVTSPPYFGLRSYLPDGHPDKHREIGLEPTPDEFVAAMVEVFRRARRVLRDDGTLWLNLGDSYANDGKWGGHTGGKHARALHGSPVGRQKRYTGYKPKDLMMIPAMVALALRADGWYLRKDIIWHKPNPMPESVTDRPTSAHEHVFLFAKSESYFYDSEAIKEDAIGHNEHDMTGGRYTPPGQPAHTGSRKSRKRGVPPRHQRYPSSDQSGLDAIGRGTGRNSRDVWTIATQPYAGAHFATMPPALAERCIKAGTRPGDIVLDPFGGAGTTGLVADRLQRNAILIELNSDFAAQARQRIDDDRGALLVAIDMPEVAPLLGEPAR